MSNPVTESAFASACPGNGVPKTSQSRIAHELQCPRYLDEDILQAGCKADAAVWLALARDDGLRLIEFGRGRHGAEIPRQHGRKRQIDDRGHHACHLPRPHCRHPVAHTRHPIPVIRMHEVKRRRPYPVPGEIGTTRRQVIAALT
jgi:hypothetical protein